MNRFRSNRSTRALILLVMSMLLMASLFGGAVATANGNPPSVECGSGVAYNKYQISDNGSVGALKVSTPPGAVITLTRVGDSGNTYNYNNTSDAWEIFRIVEKGGNDPDNVTNDPPQSGTLTTASNISHITFCLAVAPEGPTPPRVSASIVCTADPVTGVATYTLDVDVLEGVITSTLPADGAVVSNVLTVVTVNWEGGAPFTVNAQPTEVDCSFTPPNPQANPAASLAHSCDSGVTASLSNTGDASVTFTISKNGTPVDTVVVAGGGSATRTYSPDEDEAATFSITAAGLTTVTQSFVHGCIAPTTQTTTTTTTTTIPTLVLGEKIVAAAPATEVQGAKLPATGADPIPMAWLAVAFLALGTMLVRMSWPRTVFATSAGEYPSHLFSPGRRSSGWSWKLQAGRRSNGFEWGRGLSRRRR